MNHNTTEDISDLKPPATTSHAPSHSRTYAKSQAWNSYDGPEPGEPPAHARPELPAALLMRKPSLSLARGSAHAPDNPETTGATENGGMGRGSVPATMR